MKIKIADLTHTHSLGPYISTIPPDMHLSSYCLLKSTSNEIIIKPFLSLDASVVLRIGCVLKEILDTEEVYCELLPYNEDVIMARTLYFYAESQVKESFFTDLKYVGINYATKDFEILKIDKNEQQYYAITDETRIYQTNVMPSKVYGFKSVEEAMQKELYAILFERNEFEKYKIPNSNVYVLKGDARIRKIDICNNISKKIKANHLQICFKTTSKPDILQKIKDSVESTVISLVNCFDNDITKLCSVCEYIVQKSLVIENIAFVFIIDEEEHFEKLKNYLESELMVWNVEMPLMDRSGRIFQQMLTSIPNKLSRKEIGKLGKMFTDLPLFDMEDIFKAVLSSAIYDNKHNKKRDEYHVTYKHFMEVVLKNKKVMELNRGIIQRLWDMMVKRRE